MIVSGGRRGLELICVGSMLPKRPALLDAQSRITVLALVSGHHRRMTPVGDSHAISATIRDDSSHQNSEEGDQSSTCSQEKLHESPSMKKTPDSSPPERNHFASLADFISADSYSTIAMQGHTGDNTVPTHTPDNSVSFHFDSANKNTRTETNSARANDVYPDADLIDAHIGEKRISTVKAQLDAECLLNQTINEHRNALAQIQQQHADEIEQTRRQHASEIERMRRQHAAEIEQKNWRLYDVTKQLRANNVCIFNEREIAVQERDIAVNDARRSTYELQLVIVEKESLMKQIAQLTHSQ